MWLNVRASRGKRMYCWKAVKSIEEKKNEWNTYAKNKFTEKNPFWTFSLLSETVSLLGKSILNQKRLNWSIRPVFITIKVIYAWIKYCFKTLLSMVERRPHFSLYSDELLVLSERTKKYLMDIVFCSRLDKLFVLIKWLTAAECGWFISNSIWFILYKYEGHFEKLNGNNEWNIAYMNWWSKDWIPKMCGTKNKCPSTN